MITASALVRLEADRAAPEGRPALAVSGSALVHVALAVLVLGHVHARRLLPPPPPPVSIEIVPLPAPTAPAVPPARPPAFAPSPAPAPPPPAAEPPPEAAPAPAPLDPVPPSSAVTAAIPRPAPTRPHLRAQHRRPPPIRVEEQAPSAPVRPETRPDGSASSPPAARATEDGPAAAAAAAAAKDTLEGRIRAAVQAALVYPEAARIIGETGTILVGFTYRDRVISDEHVVRSCGVPLLDRAALRTVTAAVPPPAPAALAGDTLRLIVDVQFRQSGSDSE